MIQQYIRPISLNIEANKNKLDNQQGAVYLLLAIIFMAAFAVVGLAVDITNIFRYSSTLQKALDSAAVASAKVVAVIPYNEKTTTSNQERIRNAAKDILSLNFLFGNQNLVCEGPAVSDFKLFDCNVDLDNLQDEESLVITASLEVPLLLLDKLPGYPPTQKVTSSAKAEVQPAIVKMMLDTSGSMAGAKFLALKNSVEDFIGAFNPGRDFLGISFFSLDANEIADMTPNPDLDKKKKGYGTFNSTQVTASLNVSFTTSSTNQCAALYQGYLDVSGTSIPDQRTPVYILFSDGAPSAGRFFFKNEKNPPLAVNNPYGGVNTEYDYLSWLIRVNNTPVPSELARAPLQTDVDTSGNDIFPFNWGFGYPPQPQIYDSSGTAVDMCAEGPAGSAPSCPPYPPIDMSAPCSIVDVNNPRRAFDGCLDDLEFLTPDGEAWPDLEPGTFTRYLESYYNCAIAMSDYIRYQGKGVVYAIGLGTEATGGTDAYQNVLDLESRKDILFKRLANVAEYEASTPRFAPGTKYEFYNNPHDPASLIPKYLTQGSYFPVNDASSLPDVFKDLYNKIVRKIKVVQLMPVDATTP